MLTTFLLLVLFQLKHFIADYPLQTPYMLGKMQRTKWFVPLLAHASVHGAITFIISVCFVSLPLAALLACIDIVLHFCIDRLKASPNLGGRYNPTQPQFWWCLGGDQMAHHLTHYGIIFVILINL